MQTKFRSKIDWILPLAGVATPCVAVLAIVTTAGQGDAVSLLLASIVAAGAVLVVWIVASTSYEITRESRRARSGPALSMDRVEIAWGDGRVLMISPQDTAGFLATLRRRAPQLASASVAPGGGSGT